MTEPLRRFQIGDRVRVTVTPVTNARQLAGKIAKVYDITNPIFTDVDVIGGLKADHAVNVFFADLNTSFWLSDNLLEFYDHAAGTTLAIGDLRYERTEDGAWHLMSTKEVDQQAEELVNKLGADLRRFSFAQLKVISSEELNALAGSARKPYTFAITREPLPSGYFRVLIDARRPAFFGFLRKGFSDAFDVTPLGAQEISQPDKTAR